MWTAPSPGHSTRTISADSPTEETLSEETEILWSKYEGHFSLCRGPMQDTVQGPLVCQTTMERFLTL